MPPTPTTTCPPPLTSRGERVQDGRQLAPRAAPPPLGRVHARVAVLDVVALVGMVNHVVVQEVVSLLRRIPAARGIRSALYPIRSEAHIHTYRIDHWSKKLSIPQPRPRQSAHFIPQPRRPPASPDEIPTYKYSYFYFPDMYILYYACGHEKSCVPEVEQDGPGEVLPIGRPEVPIV